MAASTGALTPARDARAEAASARQEAAPRYALLEKLARFGVKSPPIVYRAARRLDAAGLAHRIESLNAFVACHEHVAELIKRIDAGLAFRIERERLELVGTCRDCSA